MDGVCTLYLLTALIVDRTHQIQPLPHSNMRSGKRLKFHIVALSTNWDVLVLSIQFVSMKLMS